MLSTVVYLTIVSCVSVNAWSLFAGFANLSDKHHDNMGTHALGSTLGAGDALQRTGGLWSKARYAARLVDAVDNNKTGSLNFTQSSTRSIDGMSLLAASNDRYDLLLVMSGTSAAMVAAQAAGSAATNNTKPVAFGNYFVPGTPDKTFLSVIFSQLIDQPTHV